MNILSKIFSYLFWALLIYFIVSISLIFSFKIVPGLNRDIVQTGIIAFFGAFFAFIFVKIAEWITIVRKGNVNHFKSLMKIERLLNRICDRLEVNIQVFGEHLDALKSKKLLVWSSHEIPFDYDLSDDLKNIDFINEYFSFSLDIERMKNDFVTLRNMHEENKGLFINEKISPDTYKDNVSFCIGEMEKIIKFMKAYQEKVIQLLAKTRLLQKEKEGNWTFWSEISRIKFNSFLFDGFPKRHYEKNFNKKVEEELEILKKEIDEVRKESQEEKNKIKSG